MVPSSGIFQAETIDTIINYLTSRIRFQLFCGIGTYNFSLSYEERENVKVI